ncbi:hypothetical protein [Flavobacterium gelatinilyticum]|mgnify:CR=1 FL=1|uniref:hypothetical protein n=1 Tax=Flavobacterium gelatinilyticum TaxID=3003260 RepID=UPI002480786A|nr:hypothetical protein [Flavobacterium gelatinilyticum]
MENTTAEQSNFKEIPQQKIYSEKAIRVSAFLGGPLAAGYFIAENFKVFDDYEKVKQTWIICVSSLILVLALILLLPENIDIPSIVFSLLYMGIASYFVKKHQEIKINEHIANGGEEFGWWRIIGISIGASLITAAVLVTLLFASEAIN